MTLIQKEISSGVCQQQQNLVEGCHEELLIACVNLCKCSLCMGLLKVVQGLKFSCTCVWVGLVINNPLEILTCLGSPKRTMILDLDNLTQGR